MYTQHLFLKLVIERIMQHAGESIDQRTKHALEAMLGDEVERAPRALTIKDVAAALHATMAPHGILDPTYARLATTVGSKPPHEQIADKVIDCATYQCHDKPEDALKFVVDILRRLVIELDGVGRETTSDEAAGIEALFTDALAFNVFQHPWFTRARNSLPQA